MSARRAAWWLRSLALCAPLAAAPAARAQAPDEMTGEYVQAVTELANRLEAVATVRNVCSNAYPALREANESAYAKWAAHNLADIAEIKGHAEALPMRMAGLDTVKRIRIEAGFRELARRRAADLAGKLNEGGAPMLKSRCESYRGVLDGPWRGQPRRFAEAQQIMRTGYGRSFVRPEPAEAAASRTVAGFALGDFPAKGQPAAMRVQSLGTGEKRPIRCRYAAGMEERGLMSGSITIDMALNGMKAPSFLLPGIEFMVSYRVAEADDEQARVEFVFSDAKLTDTQGVDAQVAERMQRELSALNLIGGGQTVTSRCASRDVKLNPVDAVNPQAAQMLRSINQSMEQMLIVGPEEPVGAGAKWQTLDTVERDGTTMYRVVSYEVLGIDGANLDLLVATELFSPRQDVARPGLAPGAKLELARMTGRSTYQLKTDFHSPLPDVGISMLVGVVANVRVDNVVNQMLLDMNMQMRIKPVAPP